MTKRQYVNTANNTTANVLIAATNTTLLWLLLHKGYGDQEENPKEYWGKIELNQDTLCLCTVFKGAYLRNIIEY